METLNRLPIPLQLILIEAFGALTKEDLRNPRGETGHFERGGKTFYRLRVGDYRIYFEQRSAELHSHFILSRHTLADFIVRMKLPYTEEALFEQDQSLWKYLEKLSKAG